MRKSGIRLRSFVDSTGIIAKAKSYCYHPMPAIILVAPFFDQNVGAVARVMLNFGFTDLRIVAPQCDYLSDAALAVAVGASDILRTAQVFSSVKDSISDLQNVYATTGKVRDLHQTIHTPESLACHVCDSMKQAKTGILFGRERIGLLNEEVALAHGTVVISSFPDFKILNLAQAVNVVSYEIWKSRERLIHSTTVIIPSTSIVDSSTVTDCIATHQELDHLLGRLEGELRDRNYFKLKQRQQTIHRQTANNNSNDLGDSNDYIDRNMQYDRENDKFRNIRLMFQRANLTKGDVGMMHGVISSLTTMNLNPT